MYYLKIYFFYSILGHLVESIVNPKVPSGILYGYWSPIYGIGVMLILLIYHMIRKRTLSRQKRIVYLFILAAVIISSIEAIGGELIELFCGRVFWNYENQLFHFGKYTSLRMGIIWGISSVLLVYVIHPFLKPLIRKIPDTLIVVLASLLVVDFLITILHLKGLIL